MALRVIIPDVKDGYCRIMKHLRDCLDYSVTSDVTLVAFSMATSKFMKDNTTKTVVLVTIEPELNWKNLAGFSFAAAITLHACHATKLSRFLGCPVHLFFQGYSAYEHNLMLQTHAVDATIDVLFPNGENSLDRKQACLDLRSAGLIVDSGQAWGEMLDVAIAKSKIVVYVPYSDKYRTFHGQRTLWAVNKGACVVSVKSDDVVLETLYNGCYITVPHVASLVQTCVSLCKSGEWAPVAAVANLRYKNMDVPRSPFILK
jgi:hypothetical protein